MTEKLRTRIFLAAGALLLGVYCYAALDMPRFGDYRGPYGDVISSLVVYQRHATDAVNAINYDYRGFDTLGEEFILFSAVLGVAMLLRRGPDVKTQDAGVEDTSGMSETSQAAILPALFVTIVFGLYIALHGQLTPGGGFQGGVILASAPVLVYLANNTEAFKRITSHSAIEVIEAAGAGGYAVIGIIPLLFGLPLLTNILPLGTTGHMFSSGNISLISDTVGVEVAAAFLLVAYTYLQEIISGQVAAK